MASSLPSIGLPTSSEVLAEVGAARPTGARKLARSAGLVVTSALLIAGVVAVRGRSATPPVEYVTSKVTKGDLVSTVTATGNVRGKDTVTVGAEISGRVRSVLVDYDSPVKAGQVLAEIDPEQLEAQLSQAKAQLAAARADVKSKAASASEAKLNAERNRALAKDGLIAEQQLESTDAAAIRAIAASESAAAQVLVAEANVRSAQTSLAKTAIRSPIDGVILSRSVEVGHALAAAMQTPTLFTVAKDLREMEVTLSIDEADVGRTRPGQHATFTVDAWPGKTFEGKLEAVHNVSVTKDNVVTYEAKVSVRNQELLLRPGMTATVVIHTDRRDGVLLVPTSSLRFSPPSNERRSMFDGPPGAGAAKVSDGRPRVWELRDGAPVEHVVEIGLSDGVSTEISSKELGEGASVIVDIQTEVK